MPIPFVLLKKLLSIFLFYLNQLIDKIVQIVWMLNRVVACSSARKFNRLNNCFKVSDQFIIAPKIIADAKYWSSCWWIGKTKDEERKQKMKKENNLITIPLYSLNLRTYLLTFLTLQLQFFCSCEIIMIKSAKYFKC